MIPEAAVEAALSFIRRNDRLDLGDREECLAIIEAAAPHMLAGAWDEGCEAMHATTGGEWPSIHEDNPYRSQA